MVLERGAFGKGDVKEEAELGAVCVGRWRKGAQTRRWVLEGNVLFCRTQFRHLAVHFSPTEFVRTYWSSNRKWKRFWTCSRQLYGGVIFAFSEILSCSVEAGGTFWFFSCILCFVAMKVLIFLC